MTEVIDQLQQALHTANQSLTHSRRLVFEALLDHEPQTMHDLIASCGPTIDRASIYRTITLFERLGIVQRLQIGWKYKLELSNNFQRHHHHLTCLQCSKIYPLAADPELERRMHTVAKQLNFLPQDHQLEIRGICSTCQKQKRRAQIPV